LVTYEPRRFRRTLSEGGEIAGVDQGGDIPSEWSFLFRPTLQLKPMAPTRERRLRGAPFLSERRAQSYRDCRRPRRALLPRRERGGGPGFQVGNHTRPSRVGREERPARWDGNRGSAATPERRAPSPTVSFRQHRPRAAPRHMREGAREMTGDPEANTPATPAPPTEGGCRVARRQHWRRQNRLHLQPRS
jgi:hypothetical protein